MSIFKRKGTRSVEITQIGFIVRNIEKTAKDYASFFGVEMPKIIETGPLSETHAEFRGKPTEGRAKLAFFRCKNITLELIEPIGGPSTWQEFLDKNGEGVHHIALNMPNGDQKSLEEKGLGIKLDQKGNFYKYLNATDSLKIMLEIFK